MFVCLRACVCVRLNTQQSWPIRRRAV